MYAWLEKPPLRTAGPQTIVTTGSYNRSPMATTSPLPARDRFSIRSGDLHGAVPRRQPASEPPSCYGTTDTCRVNAAYKGRVFTISHVGDDVHTIAEIELPPDHSPNGSRV